MAALPRRLGYSFAVIGYSAVSHAEVFWESQATVMATVRLYRLGLLTRKSPP